MTAAAPLTRRTITRLAALALLGSAASVACEPTPAQPADRPELQLSVNDAALPYGSSPARLANQGSAPVRTSVSSDGGGRITSIAGRTGSGDHALRMPGFDPTAPSPRAALLVANDGSDDRLNPGTSRLSFGADVTLDSASASGAASSRDDGDNLLQRGVWADRAQWKLEVDGRRPTCRVASRAAPER